MLNSRYVRWTNSFALDVYRGIIEVKADPAKNSTYILR